MGIEVRKIEIVEPELKIGTITYYAGDVKSFPKAEADEYIRLGWAKCCETGEQYDRVPGSQVLKVHDTIQQTG